MADISNSHWLKTASEDEIVEKIAARAVIGARRRKQAANPLDVIKQYANSAMPGGFGATQAPGIMGAIKQYASSALPGGLNAATGGMGGAWNSIKQWAEKNPSWASGLQAAGIGAGGAGLLSLLNSATQDEEERDTGGDFLTSLLAGGALGGGGYLAYNQGKELLKDNPSAPNWLRRLVGDSPDAKLPPTPTGDVRSQDEIRTTPGAVEKLRDEATKGDPDIWLRNAGKWLWNAGENRWGNIKDSIPITGDNPVAGLATAANLGRLVTQKGVQLAGTPGISDTAMEQFKRNMTGSTESGVNAKGTIGRFFSKDRAGISDEARKALGNMSREQLRTAIGEGRMAPNQNIQLPLGKDNTANIAGGELANYAARHGATPSFGEIAKGLYNRMRRGQPTNSIPIGGSGFSLNPATTHTPPPQTGIAASFLPPPKPTVTPASVTQTGGALARRPLTVGRGRGLASLLIGPATDWAMDSLGYQQQPPAAVQSVINGGKP